MGLVNALGQELRDLGEQQDEAYARWGRLRSLKRVTHFSQNHCRSLSLEIANDPEARQALCSLRDNDAQVMVNYMNLEIRDMDIFTDESGRLLYSLFCKLAKSARTFPEPFELSGIEWDRQSTPQSGGFAVVHEGLCTSSGQAVAVKVVKHVGLGALRLHVKELTLWAHLSHPNILPFYGIFRDISENSGICLVSPWMDNGNLHEYSKHCPQPERFRLLLDVVNGLSYLHNLDIVHNDLKGGNILVSGDRKALIADFGLSRIESTETRMQTVNVDTSGASLSGSSIRWTAPEILESEQGLNSELRVDDSRGISRASDIWAFGGVIYEVLSRRLPYDTHARDLQVMNAILSHELPQRPQGGAESDEIPEDSISWAIIQQCWNLDLAQRPTCLEILPLLRSALESDEEPLVDEPDPSDDAPGTPPNSKFWEDMGKKCQGTIDFTEIYHLLLEAWRSSISRTHDAFN